MSYHFGNERRTDDRRVARDPAYLGAERRAAERRHHPAEPKSKLGWYAIALVALVMVDTLVWHGYYFHALMMSFHADAAATRSWGANVWNW